MKNCKKNGTKKGLFCKLFGCKKSVKTEPEKCEEETIIPETDDTVTEPEIIQEQNTPETEVEEVKPSTPRYIKNARGAWVDTETHKFVKKETVEAWFAMDGK